MRRCSAEDRESSRIVVISPLPHRRDRVGDARSRESLTPLRRVPSRMTAGRYSSPQPDTRLAAWTPHVGPRSGAVADADGCASRRFPPVGQWRRPHGAPAETGRRDRTPTTPDGAHTYPPVQGAQRHLFGKFFLSSRESVAALGPTRLQDRAAGPCAHPVPKPVFLGTTTVIGLESSLHGRLLDSAPKHQCRCRREDPLGRTTTTSTLQAGFRFFRLWKTCYGHVPFTHPIGPSTPCG